KLCDLYTPTVITVTKSLAEFFVHNLNVCLLLAKGDQQEQCDREHGLKLYTNNCISTLHLILDLFSANVAFRIAILNAFYLIANADIARKDSSKICQFVAKQFDCLHRKRFDSYINLSPHHVFVV